MTLDPSKSPLVSLQHMLTTDPPPVEWDLKPLIMHGGRLLLAGDSASFKSWIVLDILLHVAAGRDWLGYQCPAPRRVLYVDEEMPLPELWRRVRWLVKGTPGLNHAADRFQVLSAAGYRTDKTAWLLSCLKSWKYAPEVITIETMRRTLIGSENAAEDVAAMWNQLQQIMKTGATAAMVHHTSKPNADPKLRRDAFHRPSGSGDIMGGTDQALDFTRVDRDEAVVRITHTKARGAKEEKPFHVLVQFNDADEHVRVVPSNDVQGADPTMDGRKVWGMRD